MAGASLLTLIDDIAALLDDVALLSKVAVKKSAGVLGDDLALNAQQVSGVKADRELPVVWAVAKGSLLNKAILVPGALLIMAFIPWALMPLLMIGGIYLCYEGCEKLAHRWLHDPEEQRAAHGAMLKAIADPHADVVQLEKDKIRGAIRTDFILSAEIIVIALSAISTASLTVQTTTLVAVSLVITAGVYGLVAGIVKMDDLGIYLAAQAMDHPLAAVQRSTGRGILWVAPYLMRGLSIAGTIAMFLVGGGILTHNIEPLHHAIEAMAVGSSAEHELASTAELWTPRAAVQWVVPLLADLIVGLLAGAIVLGIVQMFRKAVARRRPENT